MSDARDGQLDDQYAAIALTNIISPFRALSTHSPEGKAASRPLKAEWQVSGGLLPD